MVKYEESKYVGYDGTRMFMANWLPDNMRPRALLVAIHGLGSHGGDLSTIGEYLAERGIAVFAPDMRGFGHYSGLKGHVMKFDEYVEDIQNIMMQVKDRFLNKLTFLFGSSLGGVNAIRYVIRYPREIDGLVLHSPGVSPIRHVGRAEYMMGYVLSLLNVKKYVDSEFDYNDATRSPEVAERHSKDPLRFERVTPRFAIEGLRAAREAFESAELIQMPVLLQQAGDDKLVDPTAVKQFFERLGSPDKTWHLYEGLYHELHEEPERERVLKDLMDWFEKRLPT
ncbi:MAG: lysophospholipase [Candidatus Thorarchaeota archaeon]